MEIGVVPKSDDGTVKKGSIFEQWGEVSLDAGDAFGKTLRIVDESRGYINDAGFEDVTEHRYKIPIGGWSSDAKLKEIGKYNALYWNEGIDGWCTYLLTRYLGWQIEEVTIYIAKMRNMLRNKNIHGYHDASVVYGRKPFRTVSSHTSSSTIR